MLYFLDILLTILHLGFTLFNLAGWIWKKTRKAHLITIGLTLASWLILGIWYGLGYCVLTDWHWTVKRALGQKNLPSSFIKYYADKISGSDIPANLVDSVTAIVFVLIILITAIVNSRDYLRKRKTIS
jgi:hypothetical protein